MGPWDARVPTVLLRSPTSSRYATSNVFHGDARPNTPVFVLFHEHSQRSEFAGLFPRHRGQVGGATTTFTLPKIVSI